MTDSPAYPIFDGSLEIRARGEGRLLVGPVPLRLDGDDPLQRHGEEGTVRRRAR